MSEAIRISAGDSPEQAAGGGDAPELPETTAAEDLAGEGEIRIRKRRRRKPRPSISTAKAIQKGRRRAIGILLAAVVFVGALSGYMYWATGKLEKLRAATSWDKQKTDEKLARIEELTKNTVMRTSEILDLQDGQAPSRGLHVNDGGTLTLRLNVPLNGSSEWDLLLQGGDKGVRELGRLQTRSRDNGTMVVNLANLNPGQYELQATRSGDTRIYHYAFEIR